MTGSNSIMGVELLLGKKWYWSSDIISLIWRIIPLFFIHVSINFFRVFSKSNSLLRVCSSVYVWNFKFLERNEVSIFLISLCVGIFFRYWESIHFKFNKKLTYSRNKRFKHLSGCVCNSTLFLHDFLRFCKSWRKRFRRCFKENRRRNIISLMLNLYHLLIV